MGRLSRMNSEHADMDNQREAELVESGAPRDEAASGERDSSDPIAALQAKADALESALLRAKADFQNLQRRSAVERSEAIRFANADLMKSLLVVLDDFERALAAAEGAEGGQGSATPTGEARFNPAAPAGDARFNPALPDAPASSAVIEGIRLVFANLMKALGDHGLEPIDAREVPFDPTIHEALLHQPTTDAPPGTVIEQVAKGYRLRDRVLRPARVVVAKAPES